MSKGDTFPITRYPGHLNLLVISTSFFSGTSLQSILEIATKMEDIAHTANTYKVTGRLQQGGDYACLVIHILMEARRILVNITSKHKQ
jgi:hypothetical protein